MPEPVNQEIVSDEHLNNILRFDPLHFAEKVTGKSYRTDDAMMLGLLFSQENGRQKDEALKARDDTVLMNDLDRYLRIVGDLGFELVLEDDFIAPGHRAEDPSREEKFFIFARRDGVLLEFDTYNTIRMNGGKFYYNWVPNNKDKEKRWGILSSGSMRRIGRKDIWAGDHDAREALRFHLNQLETYGDFLPVWKAPMYMSLLHHQDWKEKPEGYAPHHSEGITRERVARLPKWVQKMVKVSVR